MEAALEAVGDDRQQVPGHGDDVDDVEVALVEHFPVIGKGGLGTVLFVVPLQPLGVDLGDRLQVQPRLARNHAEMTLGVAAAADHRGVQQGGGGHAFSSL